MVAQQAEKGGLRIFTVSSSEASAGRADADATAEHWFDGRRVSEEATKQAIDQPLHFLMAAGPIRLSHYVTGVPWYGWSVVPLLAYREWCQWPSSRWWDPPLDAAVFALGVLMATWRRPSEVRGAGRGRFFSLSLDRLAPAKDSPGQPLASAASPPARRCLPSAPLAEREPDCVLDHY